MLTEKREIIKKFKELGFNAVPRMLSRYYKDADTPYFLIALMEKHTYWAEQGQLREDGSFYWTVPMVEQYLGFRESKQKGCIKRLESDGLIQKVVHKKNERRFIVFFDKIVELINQLCLAEGKEPIKIEQGQPVGEGSDKTSEVPPTKPRTIKIKAIKLKKLKHKKHMNNTSYYSSFKKEKKKRLTDEEYNQLIRKHAHLEFLNDFLVYKGFSKTELKRAVVKCGEEITCDFNQEILEAAYVEYVDYSKRANVSSPGCYLVSRIPNHCAVYKERLERIRKLEEHKQKPTIPLFNWLEGKISEVAEDLFVPIPGLGV